MKRLLVIIAVLLLAGSGYFTYIKWVRDADLSSWSFLPQNAVFVYESDQVLNHLIEIQDLPIWNNLKRIPPFSSIQGNLQLLDTIAGKGAFSSLFESSGSLISGHITSSTSFDLLYVMEIKNISQHTYLSKSFAHFLDQGFKKRTREYLDFTITEITQPTTGSSFAYIFFKNYFIGSFTAFLVEDAIRTIADGDYPSFKEENNMLFQVARLEQDQGNIYLNTGRLKEMIGTLNLEGIDFSLGDASFLDMKLTDDAINFNGFTFIDSQADFLSIFNSTGGSSFDMAEIIPTNTAWAYHISFDNSLELRASINQYLSSTNPSVLEKRAQALTDYDFDIDHTFTLLDAEIGVVSVEGSNKYLDEKMLILEVNDMGEALRFFNSMTERYATSKNDTIYSEQYGERELRRLPIDNFPELMMGKLAQGFDQSYYMNYRNYLIFSNSIYQLKALVKSIEDEDVWNKSLRFNRFLERTNNEANFSLFVNIPGSWSRILNGLKSNWVDFANYNQQAIRNMEYAAFQFSNIDDKFYSNVTLYQPPRQSSRSGFGIQTQKAITLTGKVITKPFLVTNHYTKQKEVILQDDQNNVYLISPDFEALWSVDVSSPIINDFHQVDYYRNGKLQYAFTTSDSLHIIDRNGEYLPGFPTSIGDNTEIETFGVIDYDNSRNYRFAFSNAEGEVFLTNKDGRLLEGWNPLKLESTITVPMRHLRVARRDLMIAQQLEGLITFKTRRGENYPGFPLNTGIQTTSDFHITRGNNFSSTYYTTVTGSGELFQVNFNGKVMKREQLYRPNTETRFSIVNDVSRDSYIIVRNTGRQYEILDQDGNVLFEKDYFSKTPMLIQYYKLGGSVEWIVFVEASEQNLYIYDRSGQLVTGGPLKSGVPVSLLQYDSYYEIYLAENNQLSVVRVAK